MRDRARGPEFVPIPAGTAVASLACALIAALLVLLAGLRIALDRGGAQAPRSCGLYAGWDSTGCTTRWNVQRQAAEVAYAVDERAGNNVVALGIGVMCGVLAAFAGDAARRAGVRRTRRAEGAYEAFRWRPRGRS